MPLRFPRRLVVLLAACAACGLVPASAHASTASFADGTVTITAEPGEVNHVRVLGGPGAVFVTDEALEAGAGCDEDGGGVTCPEALAVDVRLGDRDDDFEAFAAAPVTVA